MPASAPDRHRENDLFANRDATVFGRERIAAGRAYLVAPLRAPQKQVDQQAAEQRENECEVQRNAFRKTGNKSTKMRDVSAWSNRRSLQYRIARDFVMILGEVTDERDRDEVQHDRVDNFVRSKPCFQDTRNGAPECAGQYGSRKAEWN